MQGPLLYLVRRPIFFVVLAIGLRGGAESSNVVSAQRECGSQHGTNGKTDRSHSEAKCRVMCLMHNGRLTGMLKFQEPQVEMSVFMQIQGSL